MLFSFALFTIGFASIAGQAAELIPGEFSSRIFVISDQSPSLIEEARADICYGDHGCFTTAKPFGETLCSFANESL
jgi:hypothetical protein